MVRLLGFGSANHTVDGSSSNSNVNNGRKRIRQRRLVSSARTAEDIRDKHPMFQYAVNEFAQTVPSGTSNDDGRWAAHGGTGTATALDTAAATSAAQSSADASHSHPVHPYQGDAPVAASAATTTTTAVAKNNAGSTRRGLPQYINSASSVYSARSASSSSAGVAASLFHPSSPISYQPPPSTVSRARSTGGDAAHSVYFHARDPAQQQQQHPQQNQDQNQQQQHSFSSPDHSMPDLGPSHSNSRLFPIDSLMAGGSVYSTLRNTTQLPMPYRSPWEANDMPDANYEEYYGDAYTGGFIRYQYPNGYGNMRPRSCPWKLSIIICLLFTWLSFFIVGYCSDQVDESQYRNEQIDDDTLMMEIRWCGSRPLYLMWVASMLITFLAASYCGIIGYIKIRDFAVANSRSQPPGVMDGKSDYYVRIHDDPDDFYYDLDDATSSATMMMTDDADFTGKATVSLSFPWKVEGVSLPGGGGSSGASGSSYRPSIYQADGTPQFWGSHIYRPTQAAVAITSR